MVSFTPRERIRTIINRGAPDRCGFWLGHPHADALKIYGPHFGVADEVGLHRLLGSDLQWLCPQHWPGVYNHPTGRNLFPSGKRAHGDAGPFAWCERIEELDAYEWPNPDYLDLAPAVERIQASDPTIYRASGFWTCFYHNVMDLFGMEDYLVKMYESPELVQAVTDRVCGFYYSANRRLFELAARDLDGFFFGNDFGTQTSLICGPAQFDEFILPWFKKFTDLAHDFGLQVILHSCGSIHRVIEKLIAAGVDCLHPLQARAADMDAATLARDFKGRIAFMGGIDTQELLVHGTPRQIRAEVERVKAELAPHLIVSPSHEALLPNVPPENVLAMAEAAAA